jgi:ABC-type uncharacterized transport system substrate-binding protein
MKLLQLYGLGIIFLLLLNGCSPVDTDIKKVVYVNSYHPGHPPTDEITSGLMDLLSPDSFDVQMFFMDTKRNPYGEFIQERSQEILDSILEIIPDLMVASDDNAIKYLVEPSLHQFDFPVVYCGVNWSAAQYYLPANQVTGMIEILPVAEVLQTMKTYYPDLKKLAILNENTTTSRKTMLLLDTLFVRLGISAEHRLMDDFEDWKSAFIASNENFDMIYLQTQGAIKGWDHEEAVDFIRRHIKVPVVTCEDFMIPYAVLGITQVSKEQGEWAAEAAKQILKGTSPSQIPVSRNREFKVWINLVLAERIQFEPDSLLRNSTTCISE